MIVLSWFLRRTTRTQCNEFGFYSMKLLIEISISRSPQKRPSWKHYMDDIIWSLWLLFTLHLWNIKRTNVISTHTDRHIKSQRFGWLDDFYVPYTKKPHKNENIRKQLTWAYIQNQLHQRMEQKEVSAREEKDYSTEIFSNNNKLCFVDVVRRFIHKKK